MFEFKKIGNKKGGALHICFLFMYPPILNFSFNILFVTSMNTNYNFENAHSGIFCHKKYY